MSIRKRLFLTYLLLIILFILYSIFIFSLGLLRNAIDSHTIAVYKVKNTWNEIFISLNNILINWNTGRSYVDFKTKESAFRIGFDKLSASIQAYPFYSSLLKTHLISLKRIWNKARSHIDKIVSGIENDDFIQAVKVLESKPGLQRLNQLGSDLSSSNMKMDIAKASAIRQVINDIEFFPIYEATSIRLYDTIIEQIDDVHKTNTHWQQMISAGFFIIFLFIFLISSIYFTKSIVGMYYDILILPRTNHNFINEIFTIYPSDESGLCRRTKGHYHLNHSFELHNIVKGEVIYLLQKRDRDNPGVINSAHYFRAKEKEWVVIPAEYGHTLFNPTTEEVTIYGFVAHEGMHEDSGPVGWEEPCCHFLMTKAGELIRRNNNLQPGMGLELPEKISPLDFF